MKQRLLTQTCLAAALVLALQACVLNRAVENNREPVSQRIITPQVITVNPTLFGIVYHDDNEDGRLNGSEDTPLSGILVFINSQGFSTWTTTDSKGEFSAAVPEGKEYEIVLSKPAAMDCFHPSLRSWGTHSVVTGGAKNVSSPGRVSISAEYVTLNYGPKNQKWELWHAGPVHNDARNTVLVHGEHIVSLTNPGHLGPGQQRGINDDEFGELDNLLQAKRHGGYNVWEFEYAERYHDGKYWTHYRIPNYARRLNLVLQRIQRLSGNDDIGIVAHSLGGLIARYTVQSYYRSNKIITLATGHAGFEIADIADDLRGKPCVSQMLPGSDVLEFLASTLSSNNFLLASLAASEDEPTHNVSSMVTYGSANTTPLDETGKINSAPSQSYFTVVKADHYGIKNIRDPHNSVFQLIREFLTNGISEKLGNLSPRPVRHEGTSDDYYQPESMVTQKPSLPTQIHGSTSSMGTTLSFATPVY